MWSKKEQLLLWILAYLPLIAILILKFLLENDIIPDSLYSIWRQLPNNKTISELVYTSSTLLLFTALGILIMKFGLKKARKADSITKMILIKKYRKPRADHYSFFLVTMLLPLFSLDVKSITNLFGALIILILVIIIYVKTDSISTNPLFFLSGKHIYEADIQSMNGHIINTVYLISDERDLDLNNSFKVQHLVENIYYILCSEPT